MLRGHDSGESWYEKSELMKQIFYFLSLIIVFAACGSDAGDKQLVAEIETLEKEVETQTTGENTKSLMEKYLAYIESNPEDHNTNSNYLYRAAKLQYKMNRYQGAVNYLKQALKNHYEGENTANNALFLASIYNDRLRNPEGASAVYQCFVEAFPNNEKTAAIKGDYPSWPAYDDRLKDLGERLMNDSTNRIDYSVANDFINTCELHALILPKNDKSAEYLHKAGETARSIRKFPMALSFYEWICERYPEHPKAAQALFLQGFTYDNDLKDLEKARALYTAFIEKYPNDDFADDTQFLLDNLGKDDEEIIQQFSEQ